MGVAVDSQEVIGNFSNLAFHIGELSGSFKWKLRGGSIFTAIVHSSAANI